jgi:hypothetical protein
MEKELSNDGLRKASLISEKMGIIPRNAGYPD